MDLKDQNWFERHPKKALILINCVLMLAALMVGEVFLRFYVPFNPGYYMAVETTASKLVYPWGEIPVNNMGFADEPFELSEKPRVGYLGDSVNFGVGAGYGYRISELLEREFPQYDHWNLGGIGADSSHKALAKSLRTVDELKLSKVIYLFNLNDIVPDQRGSSESKLMKGQRLVSYFDWFRGKSFLYTFVRTKVKNMVKARGYEASGYRAVELFPTDNASVLAQTAARLVTFHDELAERSVALEIVFLPYEMQVSNSASKRYRELGFSWEPGFEDGLTQQQMRDLLPPRIKTHDGRLAFKTEADNWRDRHAVGETFVYDKGDKMDWNHPNRLGHQIIADYLKPRLFPPTP